MRRRLRGGLRWLMSYARNQSRCVLCAVTGAPNLLALPFKTFCLILTYLTSRSWLESRSLMARSSAKCGPYSKGVVRFCLIWACRLITGRLRWRIKPTFGTVCLGRAKQRRLMNSCLVRRRILVMSISSGVRRSTTSNPNTVSSVLKGIERGLWAWYVVAMHCTAWRVASWFLNAMSSSRNSRLPLCLYLRPRRPQHCMSFKRYWMMHLLLTVWSMRGPMIRYHSRRMMRMISLRMSWLK